MVREDTRGSGANWFADEGSVAEVEKRPEFSHALLAHAQESLAIVDARGKCILVNRALCEMTGFSAAELLTTPPYPYWPPDERDAIMRALSDHAPAELSFQRKNGERFRALLRRTPVRDERDTALATLHTVIDLSATSRAEGASEQRWRSLVENPFDFVMIIGPDYKYRFINQLLPGLTNEDMIGRKSPFDFIPVEDHPRVRQLYDETFRTGRPSSYEVFVPEYQRWYSNVVGAIKSDGEVRELSLLARDITEAKRVERAQRRSERRLALALGSVQDGVVEVDPRTGQHVYSARAYELFGFAEGDPGLSTQADGLLARVHPDDLPRISRARLKALERGGAFDQEFRMRARDGSYRWFNARGRTVDDEDEQRFLCFLTDVTQRYEAEEQRRALAAELQQAQRLETIGTLAGGIAHDFNNLLTPIMVGLEFAQMELPAGHTAQAVLEDARAAADRAKSLTEQILSFARREQPRLDPVDLVQAVRDELRLHPIAAGVQLVTDFPSDCPCVLGDRAQLQQIIANLLTNALHAMEGMNGQLLLRVDRVQPGSADVPSSDYARLTVSDQGVGMPESVQRRVFEPFFTTKPQGEGTGLGLAVVHGVVKRHGGQLKLRSEPDKGTTFEIYLPTCASSVARPSEPAPRAPLSAGLTGHIVCVDDEVSVLSVMKSALALAKFSVNATTSPSEALEWLRTPSTRIDVLVTDYRMPQLSGLELAQRARALRPDMPVILVTGHAEGLPRSGNPVGIQTVMYKPFRIGELISAVQKCLATRAVAKASARPAASG